MLTCGTTNQWYENRWQTQGYIDFFFNLSPGMRFVFYNGDMFRYSNTEKQNYNCCSVPWPSIALNYCSQKKVVTHSDPSPILDTLSMCETLQWLHNNSGNGRQMPLVDLNTALSWQGYWCIFTMYCGFQGSRHRKWGLTNFINNNHICATFKRVRGRNQHSGVTSRVLRYLPGGICT